MKTLNIFIVLGILLAGRVYVFSHGMRAPYYGHHYENYQMGGGAGYCYEDSKSLSEELKLTKDQKEKIDKINKEYWAKYDKNMGNHDVMWKLHESHDKAIAEVLTTEQKKLLDKSREGRRFRGNRNRGRFSRGRGCW